MSGETRQRWVEAMREQSARLREDARVHHALHARLDRRDERLARRHEADPGRWDSAVTPPARGETAGEERRLDVAHHASHVTRVDPRRGRWIELTQPLMERLAPITLRVGLDPRAQHRIGRDRREVEAIQQSAHVQAGPAHDDRGATGRCDRRKGGTRVALVTEYVVALARIGDVYEVMRDTGALLGCRLRGPDIHAAVHLTRIGGNDLAAERFRDTEREGTLSRRRRTDDGYDGRRAFSNVRSATRAWSSVVASGAASP